MEFHNGRVHVHHGDCREVLAGFDADSFDAVCCDPPYGLKFMNRHWDYDIPGEDTWRAVLRVLKPGGHMVAFSGTRTYHRMTCAIEDAGFEVRDAIMWHYGSGFPKSHDISKAIDLARNDHSEWRHVGTWLHNQREAKGLKQKEVAALWPSITGGITGCVANWELGFSCPKWNQWLALKELIGFNDEMDAEVWRLNGRKGQPGEAWNSREFYDEPTGGLHRGTGNTVGAYNKGKQAKPGGVTDAAIQWQGWGSALKPATEIICLARKPLSESTIAGNVLRWNCGALNIDGCRVATNDSLSIGAGKLGYGSGLSGINPGSQSPLGRWPANLCHDNSPEVLEGFPESDGAVGMTQHGSGTAIGTTGIQRTERSTGGNGIKDSGSAARFFASFPQEQGEPQKERAQPFSSDRGWNSHSMTREGQSAPENYNDKGSAARFFASFPGPEADQKRFWYGSKAAEDDRLGSKHPTVKPVSLISWLCRLITPPARFVCPQCAKQEYEKSTQKVRVSSSLRTMREDVQAARQHGSPQVLQQAMRQQGDEIAAEEMRDMPRTISAEGLGSEVLRHDLFVEVDGEKSVNNERLRNNKGGLQDVTYADASSIPCTGGLHIRASVDHREENRQDADKERGGSPHQWNKERQSTGEFAADVEGGPRQTEPSAAQSSDLSSLHREVLDQQTCSNCGGQLVQERGRILDCFAGTGTTAEAALREGFSCTLIEREPEYIKDIERRMALVFEGETGRSVAMAKLKPEGEALPLFPEAAE